MNWHTCWLRGLAHTCGGGYHRHHLINRSKVPKKLRNKAMRDNLNKLLVPVCAKANVSRIADSGWGQRKLLERLLDEYGEDFVISVFEEILGKFKRYPHELSVEAILAGPDPPQLTA